MTQPVTDPFPLLLGYAFRGLGFPVVDTMLEVRQDLVIHKFADRDGAHVEGTGRHPFQITARIPFLNGIQPGPQETWQSNSLYPLQWRGFFKACCDNSSGTLVHPELGPLTVKVEHCRTVWAAAKRSGVEVEVSWIESDDSGTALASALASPSPLAGLLASAAAIDEQIAALQGDPSAGISVYQPPATISSLVASVTLSVGIQGSLGQASLGQCAVVIQQATAVQASLYTEANSSALSWPLVLSCDQAIEAARNTRATLLQGAAPVSLYTTLKDSTLGQLAAVIPADIGVLISLNGQLCAAPVVPAGTVVRFYPLSAALTGSG